MELAKLSGGKTVTLNRSRPHAKKRHFRPWPWPHRTLETGGTTIGYHILFLLQEVVGRDTCLFENGPKRSFRHVTGMIGYSGVSVGLLIVPDLMTAGGLAVKGETKRLEPLGYFSIPESG